MEHLKPPRSLQLSGNVSENWKKWKQAFKVYLNATEAQGKDEAVKCALFLHIAGEEALEVYNTFHLEKEEVDKLDVLFERFEKYCIPRKNVTFERHCFNIRNQGSSETIDQYVTDLKTLAQSCEFGDLKDSLIRDRIVCGTKTDAVRRRLLREKDLTLQSAIDICRAAEVTTEQMKALTEDESKTVHAIKGKDFKYSQKYRNTDNSSSGFGKKPEFLKNKRETKQKCERCGTLHSFRQCPAFGQKCRNCGKMNHYAKQCKARKIQTVLVENESTSSESEETLYVGTVNDSPVNEGGSWYATLDVNGEEIKFKVDTGSQVNTLPKKRALKALKGIQIKKSNRKLTGYGGNEIPVIGIVELTGKYKGKNESLEFFVIDRDDSEPILGLPTSTKLDIVRYVSAVYKEENTSPKYGKLVEDYKDVFSGNGTLDYTYKIRVDPTVTPKVCQARRVPLALEDKLKEELEKMENQGIIAKVTEPTDWVNPIVVVEKPDGSLRICLDPFALNKAIKREHYIMPTIEEIASRISGAKVFSTLDAEKGFWQIPLEEESTYLTTFATPFGRYRFLKMPFGIKSAPEVFAKTMDNILEGTEGTENFYDDILVWGKDTEEHDKRLTEIMEKSRQEGLRLNLKKCQFGQSDIKYLGHIFSSEGLKIDPNKVRAITEMATPTTVQELERFLGMVTFVAKFIPTLSQGTTNLRELTKAQTPWVWNEKHEDEVSKLKLLITTAPVLKYYEVKKPVVLQTDASKDGSGAALIQEGRPVAYASKAFTDTQKKYAQIEKELLAIAQGCDRFHQYIYGKEVIVETDHKPLESILKKPLCEATPRLQRIMLRLQNYQLNVQYKKGKEMYLADTLSRAFLEDTSESENDLKVHVMEQELNEEIEDFAKNKTEHLPISEEKMQKLKEETAKDEALMKLRKCVLEGWPDKKNQVAVEIKDFYNYRDEITEIGEILFKGAKVIVPKSMQKDMLEIVHQGHWGIERSRSRARQVIFWPNMNEEIATMISRCETCLKHRNANQKEPLIPHEVPELPWQVVASDLFQLWNDHYLVVIDYYSKFFEFVMLRSTTSEAVITHLKSIFARHGIPLKVITDNGPQFSSAEFQKFAKIWGFQHVTSSPTYPKSNGLAERTVQTLKKMLKKSKDDSSDPYLGMLAYRNTPFHNLGSPAELSMGRNLRSQLPESKSQLKPKVLNTEDVKNHWFSKKEDQRKHYDQHAKDLRPLKVNEEVRFRVKGKWEPAIVSKKRTEPRSYDLKTQRGNILRRNRVDIQAPNKMRGQKQNFQDDDLEFLEEDVSEGRPEISADPQVNPPLPDKGISTAEEQNTSRQASRYGRRIIFPSKYKDFV